MQNPSNDLRECQRAAIKFSSQQLKVLGIYESQSKFGKYHAVSPAIKPNEDPLFLVFPDGRIMKIGEFVEISK